MIIIVTEKYYIKAIILITLDVLTVEVLHYFYVLFMSFNFLISFNILLYEINCLCMHFGVYKTFKVSKNKV